MSSSSTISLSNVFCSENQTIFEVKYDILHPLLEKEGKVYMKQITGENDEKIGDWTYQVKDLTIVMSVDKIMALTVKIKAFYVGCQEVIWTVGYNQESRFPNEILDSPTKGWIPREKKDEEVGEIQNALNLIMNILKKEKVHEIFAQIIARFLSEIKKT